MSFLNVLPDAVTAAAGNLQSLSSALSAANAAAATPTIAIAPAGTDQVSAAITALFGKYGQEFQALGAKAATFHDEFVNLLRGGAAQYLSTEVANAQQALVNALNAPARTLLGQPLIGTVQAASAAATFPATAQNFNLPLGPFELSASYSGAPSSDGSLFASGSAAAKLNTPFGPLTFLSASGTAAVSTTGPVFAGANLTSPAGPLALSLSGTTVTGPGGQAIQFTGGTFVVPPMIPLLAATAGPAVTGWSSLANSAGAFFTAVGDLNFLGAATAVLGAPFDFSNAVMFGHTMVTVPDSSSTSVLGIPVLPSLHIPFGGFFASLEPATMTWPTVSAGGAGLIGSEFALQGTRFGGFFPALMNAFSLPL